MMSPASPDVEKITELERQFSRRTLLARYASGRVRHFPSRLAVASAGASVLMLVNGWQYGLGVLAIMLLGEVVDCLYLRAVPRRLKQGWGYRHVYFASTVTAILQAGSTSVAMWLSWFGPASHDSPLFSIVFLAGAAINGGIVQPFHPAASIARLVVYAFTVMVLFAVDWHTGGTPDTPAMMNAFGTLMLGYMVFLFIDFVKGGFKRNRHNLMEITARGREIMLREKEAQRLSLVARNANDSVVLSDVNRRIVWVNDAFTRITGYDAQEAMGRTPIELLNGPETDLETTKAIDKAVRAGVPFRGEIQNITKEGRKIWIETNLVPVLDTEGNVEMTVAIERDVTDARAHAQEMAAAKVAAEEGARAKAEFLATMSHEIRTPMNGVIGMTDMLDATTMTAEQRQYVETIRSSAQALVTIINDILDMSKLDAQKMTLLSEPFDLRSCIEQTALLMQPQAQAKGLDLIVSFGNDIPLRIVGDDGRFRQVVLNLLGNAVKFTENGCIEIDVSTVSESEATWVVVSVRDTGIGIPNDRLEDVFERFVQADAATTRRFGGTGLGLTITRMLVEAMGGTIRVDSQEGVGSCFSLTLPAQEAPVSLVQTAADADDESVLDHLNGRRILLAEDNKVNRLLVRKFLGDLPIELDFAHDGQQAVEMARDWQPDLIFMDMSMPVMSGVEATEHIRCLGGQQPRIVALTANAFDSDRSACIKAGMDGFLSKPVRRAELLASLVSQLPKNHLSSTN